MWWDWCFQVPCNDAQQKHFINDKHRKQNSFPPGKEHFLNLLPKKKDNYEPHLCHIKFKFKVIGPGAKWSFKNAVQLDTHYGTWIYLGPQTKFNTPALPLIYLSQWHYATSPGKQSSSRANDFLSLLIWNRCDMHFIKYEPLYTFLKYINDHIFIAYFVKCQMSERTSLWFIKTWMIVQPLV